MDPQVYKPVCRSRLPVKGQATNTPHLCSKFLLISPGSTLPVRTGTQHLFSSFQRSFAVLQTNPPSLQLLVPWMSQPRSFAVLSTFSEATSTSPVFSRLGAVLFHSYTFDSCTTLALVDSTPPGLLSFTPFLLCCFPLFCRLLFTCFEYHPLQSFARPSLLGEPFWALSDESSSPVCRKQ